MNLMKETENDYTSWDQNHGMWVSDKRVVLFSFGYSYELWYPKRPRPVNKITNIATTSETCSM